MRVIPSYPRTQEIPPSSLNRQENRSICFKSYIIGHMYYRLITSSTSGCWEIKWRFARVERSSDCGGVRARGFARMNGREGKGRKTEWSMEKG